MLKTVRIGLLTAAILALASPARSSDDGDRDRKALVRQGAREWGAYCGTCHNARPAGERSPAEWDVIMMHMRARANIPAADARALVEFLKAR